MIALFGLLLLLPEIAQLLGFGAGSGENRTLAPFPNLNQMKEIKDLPRQADAYVNDRFGLRSQLVHFNSMLRYHLGVSSSKDVVIGKDGWLFYAAEKILEQHVGADLFKPEELENWVRRMEANRDWLANRGIAFFILVAPDKNTIYPDKLPDYPRPPGATTRFDQLAERMRASTLEFIDPRAALIEAREKGLKVYFEGDTHWTQRGAFIAYSLLMKRIHHRFPEAKQKTVEDYKISLNVTPAADLARLLALEGDLKYSIEQFTLNGSSREIRPASVTYRPGWPWRIMEMHTDAEPRPRLMVMGDSFTDYVLGPNFLYETFRDPVWTNHHLGNFNFSLVKEMEPDVVIFQLAERYLRAPVGTPLGMD